MGVSLLTAMIIQTSDIDVRSYQSVDRFGFELGRFERGIYRPVITSDPQYHSLSEAKEAGDNLVETIRNTDLSKPK